MGIDFGHWIGNAVKTLGKPISLAGQALQTVTGAVTHEIGKIPVIGKPFAAVFDIAFIASFGPLEATGQIIDGKRIDKVILGQLQDGLKDFKEVGPYVQMVISFVPGIGTGISAAIGAGLALANGQPISEAMMAGLKGAIPGGPAATAIFDVAQESIIAAEHHVKMTWDSVAKIAGSAAADLVGLPEAAKDAILGTLTVAGGLSRGEKPELALADGALDSVKHQVPPAIAKALQIGVAVAHATAIQSKKAPAIVAPSTTGRLIAQGRSIATMDPVVKAARNSMKEGYNGFDIGIALTRLAASTHDLIVLRNSLSPTDKAGFDLALSLHIGRVAQPPHPQIQSAGGQAAYFATMGMQGAKSASKAAAMQGFIRQPSTKVGAQTAVNIVMTARGSLWDQFLRWLHDFFIGQ